MRRREDLPLQKHTLNLFEGDFQFIKDTFGQVGAGRAIRRLVRNFRLQVEAGVKKNTVTVDVDGIEL